MMNREEFDFLIEELERLTMIVCPNNLQEEYWLKYKDADYINVQETIFNKPIKEENFPITYQQYERFVEIMEESAGNPMPEELITGIWEDYGHLGPKAFADKMLELFDRSKES